MTSHEKATFNHIKTQCDMLGGLYSSLRLLIRTENIKKFSYAKRQHFLVV